MHLLVKIIFTALLLCILAAFRTADNLPPDTARLQCTKYDLKPQIVKLESRKVIVMVDSDVDLSMINTKLLCKNGILSATKFPNSHTAHGTNVYNLIAKNLNSETHCIQPIVFLNSDNHSYCNNASVSYALMVATELKPKFVNLSLEGALPFDFELQQIKNLLHIGSTISVAAGNEIKNLDKQCNVFPACYADVLKNENFHVVGAVEENVGNTGKIVQHFEPGQKQGVPEMTGTSQSTANHTNKLVLSDN